MRITILKDESAFNLAVAWKIVEQILAKPNALIGLATGRTTGGIHKAVADICRSYPFDVSSVRFYGVDEIVMVPETFSGSCANMIRRELTDPLGISDNLVMPPTLADDYDRAGLAFAAQLDSLGGADLQILGIGPDGHVGMNLPGAPFGSETRFTKLSGELEERIRKSAPEYPKDAPLGGITLGIRTIMRMPKLILAAKGAAKAEIVERAVRGPVTENLPASVLQLHPCVEVMLDADAASGLR